MKVIDNAEMRTTHITNTLFEGFKSMTDTIFANSMHHFDMQHTGTKLPFRRKNDQIKVKLRHTDNGTQRRSDNSPDLPIDPEWRPITIDRDCFEPVTMNIKYQRTSSTLKQKRIKEEKENLIMKKLKK